jgi:putative Mn2+ efflux pump MntP
MRRSLGTRGSRAQKRSCLVMLGLFALFMLLPLLVGAAIGTLISRWLWGADQGVHDPDQRSHDPVKARPVGS